MKNSPSDNSEAPASIKPKIIQISASLKSELGGPVQVVKSISKRISKNFENKLIVFGESEITNQNIMTVKTCRKNRFGFHFNSLEDSLARDLREADILLVHGFYLFSTLTAIRQSPSSKVFIMPHGSLEMYQQKVSRVKKKIFDLIFFKISNGREVTFLVGSVSEIVGVKARIPGAKVKVVGLGIESIPTQFLHSVSPNSRLELLCFSRIAPKKRLDLCILATRNLRDIGIDAKLTIAGSGDFRLISQLKELVNKLEINSSVEFIDFVDGEQKHVEFQKSDIFLLPSENENFAVAVAESISYQVPVVVSTYVAMKDFVINHKAGEVIDTLDVSVLVAAILKVKDDYFTYWENCKKSRSLLSWDEVIKNWERELLSQVYVEDES